MSDETRDADIMGSPVERYFDGTLSAAETRDFEAQLANEPALQAELAALRDTRELLQVYVTERVDAVDFSNFFANIQAQLPVESPAVESVEAPARATPPATRSTGDRVKAWWSRYWTPVLVSTAAAAAVAFLVTRAAAPAANDGDDDAVVAGIGVQVDEVSNDGPQTVLIAMPVEDDDESATVIWLVDGEDEAGADSAGLDGEDPI